MAETVAMPLIDQGASCFDGWGTLFQDIGGKDIGGKIVCVFDDIPVLLKRLLPASLGKLGPIMLSTAGFLVLSLEMKEGWSKYKKASQLPLNSPERAFRVGSNVNKMIVAALGMVTAGVLLYFVIAGITLGEAIASFLIPTALAIISAIELAQKFHAFYHVEENNKEAMTKAARKVVFAAIYFVCSSTIASLATLSALTGLGILSWGVIPSAILVGVVVVAMAIKIFEIVDKKKNYKFTDGMRNKVSYFFSASKNSLTPDSQESKDNPSEGMVMPK